MKRMKTKGKIPNYASVFYMVPNNKQKNNQC